MTKWGKKQKYVEKRDQGQRKRKRGQKKLRKEAQQKRKKKYAEMFKLGTQQE